MYMMPEGAVIIPIKEYNRLMKCQKVVEKIFESCKAHESAVNEGELHTLFYASNVWLQELFPDEYGKAILQAKENYFKEKLEVLKNV